MNILELLSHIKANIPFYKNIDFENESDIAKLPIISKNIIRENYNLFISDTLGKGKDELVDFFATHTQKAKGWYNEIAILDNIIVEETSGTSGTPFLCAKTTEERNNLALALWHQRLKIDKYVSPKNLFSFSHIGMGKQNPNAYDYSPKHLNKLYTRIQNEEMRWIHGTPSAFINHIRVLEENNLKFDFSKLRYIECTGFYLNDDTKKEIEKYFGVTVINQYGCIETWPIALSCKNNILHINERSVYIEIIDEDGNVINEKNKIGLIVVTTLYHRIFPLVRYALGDFAEYIENDNCGLKGKAIHLLEGRAENIIKGLETKKFGNIEFLTIVKTAKFSHRDIDLRYIQFVQVKEDQFMVNINDFNEVYNFINTIKSLTQNAFQKPIVFDINLLSEEEILLKKYDKPNLFICRC